MTLSGILALAAAFRVVQYSYRPSLWYDEAMLSFNVAARSWAALLRPLDFEQAAPVPYLFFQKLAVLLGGANEYMLRLAALLAGVLLPWAFWQLARKFYQVGPSLAGTALIAFSPMLLRYSNEAKPYELDALLTSIFLLLAVAVIEHPGSQRRWVYCIIGGTAIIVSSVPAIFVAGSVICALASVPAISRHPQRRHWLLGLAAVWCLAFTTVYLAFYRFSSANHPLILDAWEYSFLRPGAPDLPSRLWFALTETATGLLFGTLDAGRWSWIVMTLVQSLGVVALALCGLGFFTLMRRGVRWQGILLGGPLVLAGVASGLGRYPMTIRLLLFATPGLFLLLVQGIRTLSMPLPVSLRRYIAAVIALGLLFPGVARALMTSVSPIRRQDARPVIATVLSRRAQNDAVYVYSHAIPAWAFYATDWAAPDTGRLSWITRMARAGGPAFPASPSRHRAVSAEGFDLSYAHDGRLELLGIPTGRRERWGRAGNTRPDSGWAENEAERMRMASKRVWLIFVPLYPGDREPNLSLLQEAIRGRGGRTVLEVHRREADAFLVRFP